MNSPDPVPGRGVAPNGSIATSMLAGAVVVVLVWIVKVAFTLDIPANVQDALIIIFMACGAWAHPAGRVPKGPAP
jgi:Na+/glutamate symporter